jgi:hypothetical protein
MAVGYIRQDKGQLDEGIKRTGGKGVKESECVMCKYCIFPQCKRIMHTFSSKIFGVRSVCGDCVVGLRLQD